MKTEKYIILAIQEPPSHLENHADIVASEPYLKSIRASTPKITDIIVSMIVPVMIVLHFHLH